MADTKISELTSITGANVNDTADELAIVDDSATQTKKITRAELFQDVLKIKVGGGADGISTADELVLSKDQTNVGMSLLAADATGVVRIYLGSQTDTQAARLLHNETNDEMILQAAGALQLQSGGMNDRLLIDSSGNVGINTTSPSAVLDVVGQSGAGAVTIDDGDYGLEIGTYNAPTKTDLVFTSNAVVGSQTSLSFVAETGGYHRFMTGGTSHKTGTSGASEAMRIDSSGNVGIGTTSPSASLDVTGTVESTVSSTGDFNFNAISSGGGNYRIYPDDATTANPTWLHQSNSSEDQAWVIGGVERMRLDSSGNVGIGTTSPATKLHVQDADNTLGTKTGTLFVEDTEASVEINSASGGDCYVYFTDGNTNATSGGSIKYAAPGGAGQHMALSVGGSEAMRIDSSGHVVVNGTTALVDAALTVIEKDTEDGISFGSSDGTLAGFIGTSGEVDNENKLVIRGNRGAGGIVFKAASSEVMHIKPNGRVGIGNTSPSEELDVTGNAAVSGKAKVGTGADGASNSDELVLSKDQTNVGMSILAADATGICRILFGSQTSTNAAKIQHSESNSRLFVQAEGDLYFQTGGTNTKMTLNTDGDLDVTGALSKGSGSFKIDHPLKPDTHHLVHSFIEGPQADNIYRGTVALVGGAATVNLDTAGRMSEGTFVALNGNVQCFTSNEQGWTAVRGSVSGNTLTIEAQDATCTDTVSWMVVGERHDQHMIDTAWTDAQGRVITEPEKVEDTQEEAE